MRAGLKTNQAVDNPASVESQRTPTDEEPVLSGPDDEQVPEPLDPVGGGPRREAIARLQEDSWRGPCEFQTSTLSPEARLCETYSKEARSANAKRPETRPAHQKNGTPRPARSRKRTLPNEDIKRTPTSGASMHMEPEDAAIPVGIETVRSRNPGFCSIQAAGCAAVGFCWC